jgi:hypothetical protein
MAFREQKKIETTDVKNSNPNRNGDFTIAGRRRIEFTDNSRLPNVFPRPDEFDKIRRLGGFMETNNPIPLSQDIVEKGVLTYKNSRYNREVGLKMNGRIETYIHSDSLTSNKGGVIVKIACETDFAAKTQEFIEFCKSTARLLYAVDVNGPVLDYESYIMEIDPDFRTRLGDLEKKLKEKIEIVEFYKICL